MIIKRFCGIIIGAPGSGKGTISDRIVKEFNLKHISSGDLLRRNIEAGTQLGKTVESYISDGQLVPDNIINDSILNEIRTCNNKWLLDGYPRTIVQVEKLWSEQKLDTVIYLNVPFRIIIERLKSRWVHLPSGRVYNIGFNTPKVLYKDDITGEDLVQRPDDLPTAVSKRLEIFEQMTKPVLQFYKEKNILNEFCGETSDEIWPKVKTFLQNMKK